MGYDVYGNWVDDGYGDGGYSPGPAVTPEQGARDAAQTWLGRDPTPAELAIAVGNPAGAVGYFANIAAGRGDPRALAATGRTAGTTTDTTGSGDTGTGGGTTGASTGGPVGTGQFLDYYAWGGPRTPDLSWLSAAPAFNAPQFQAPGAEGMFADPGYQFRLDQGRKALEQSAAGRGTLRTGGTLKDILGYGQNMASQEYGNVFNRALSAYTNNYNAARDAYAPQLATWERGQSAGQTAATQAFNRAWDAYSHAVPSATTLLNAGLT